MMIDMEIEMNQDTIEVGTNVRWVSAAGTLEGTVKSIKLGRNAAGDMIPWVLIEGPNFGIRKPLKTRLAATQHNLTMMRVRVI